VVSSDSYDGDVSGAFSTPGAVSAERPRVLLADDHSATLAVTAEVLAGECLIVARVGNGSELLAEAERLHPDVIVLDITMPRLDGIEAARQLRRSRRPARLVFLTVHEDTDYAPGRARRGYVVKARLAFRSPACHPGGARRSPLRLAHRAP
jgi:CheY-like chemotaxis protein